MTIRKYLNIGHWNIHSLKSRLFDKSTDKTILREIFHYDIFCLKETKHENINVVDFCTDQYHSVKISPNVKIDFSTSGGMILMINKNIKQGVSILKKTQTVKHSGLNSVKLFWFKQRYFCMFCFYATVQFFLCYSA